MRITDIVIPTETVSVGLGQDFAVQGLSFEAISRVFARHTEVAATLFAQFTAGQGLDESTDLKSLRFGEIGRSLLQRAPEVVVDIIANGLDDSAGGTPEELEAIRRLPMPVQVDALEKIGRLTFTSEEVLGKLMESVITTFEGTTKAISSLKGR